ARARPAGPGRDPRDRPGHRAAASPARPRRLAGAAAEPAPAAPGARPGARQLRVAGDPADPRDGRAVARVPRARPLPPERGRLRPLGAGVRAGPARRRPAPPGPDAPAGADRQPGGAAGGRPAACGAARSWRLIRARIALIPRRRSGEITSASPSLVEKSPGVSRTS